MSGLVGGKKAAEKVARSAGVPRTRRARAGKPSVDNGQPGQTGEAGRAGETGQLAKPASRHFKPVQPATRSR